MDAKEFKKIFTEYKEASRYTDTLEKQIEEEGDPSEKLEKMWDEAYQDEFDKLMKTIKALRDLIGVDQTTARRMIATAGDEIQAIVDRLA